MLWFKRKKKIFCDICGEDLSKLGPLGRVSCEKCGLHPICTHCINIHDCCASAIANGNSVFKSMFSL